MLDETLKAQLGGYLELISRPVDIIASLDGGEPSRQMRALLADIESLSNQVRIGAGASDGAGFGGARVPSFALRAAGAEDPRIRFAGVPLGHELTSLVLALLQTGGHPPKVDPAVAAEIQNLPGDLSFETFVSLSCQNCPDVVQALNTMAVLNPRIRHTMIDGALFPDEVSERQIMAVPAVFLNGRPFAQGRMELTEILAKLDSGSREHGAERLGAKPPFDVLVIGAGPAGAAAAIYAARKGIRTGIAAERVGGQLLDTLGIENFISVKETQGHKLAYGLEQHVSTYDVDVMSTQRAESIVPGDLIEVKMAGGGTLKARSLIIATGARWRELDVPGEKQYRNRGVAYCPHCDGPLFKGRRVAVIGGGNSGVEAAIDLAGLVSHVTLIEYDRTLRADAVLQAKLRSLRNVTVITGARTTEVLGDGERVTGLVHRDRDGGAGQVLEIAGVFVQIGLKPNTDWLEGIVKLSPRGEVEVDARGQTSVAGVFAAGDCTVVPYKQIVIAVGEGAKASLSACDHLIRTPARAAA
ncbi:MAG TPA: alkyl hydroperoxide reductase subunit F [Steroidobacteraceae bacterium]|jgi:alkyl hydroperoxide reductase subunit F|nr:alkyl hydroperoxide reductase subunit F [Steroidobacteraceae bacterium]